MLPHDVGVSVGFTYVTCVQEMWWFTSALSGWAEVSQVGHSLHLWRLCAVE